MKNLFEDKYLYLIIVVIAMIIFNYLLRFLFDSIQKKRHENDKKEKDYHKKSEKKYSRVTVKTEM